MSVPFEQAIEELYSIFGGFDKEIIETVLRQNKGHMEKTIDALLEMNGEQPINENTDQDQNLAQIDQDEMLARMMQNQLFLNELRNDDDFSGFFNNGSNRNSGNNNGRTSLPKEELEQFQRERALRQQQQLQQQRQQVEDEPSALSLFEEDFQDLKVKFNQLGETAKNKFRELTEMFNNSGGGSKKEETKYEPIKTENKKLNSDNDDDEDDNEDEEDVVVYDKYNKGVSNRHHTGIINSNYSLNNSDGDEEFDSFILESDRNRTRLRSTAAINYGEKKDL